MGGDRRTGTGGPLLPFLNMSAIQAWTPVTVGMVATRISGKELAAFRIAATTPGGGDPVDMIIAIVVELVRGSVAGCPKNKLGPRGTIPSVLLDAALSVIVMRIMVRPGAQVMDRDAIRKDEGERAERLLRDVSRCEGPAIAAPDEPATGTEVQTLPMQYYSPNDERFGRCETDGL